MKFFVDDKEKEFFKQNGLLGIEEIFSPEEIDLLRREVEKKVFLHEVKDLALSGGEIQKILFSKKMAQVAFELAGKSPLRYGYDLFFRCSSAPKALSPSISPLLICACIPLESDETIEEHKPVPFILHQEDLYLPKGAVLFFAPNVLFSLSSSQAAPDPSYLLFVYSGLRAQYTYQVGDPFTHDLKRLGYVFGDRLKSATHPILYR
jgi:hypothetical protein